MKFLLLIVILFSCHTAQAGTGTGCSHNSWAKSTSKGEFVSVHFIVQENSTYRWFFNVPGKQTRGCGEVSGTNQTKRTYQNKGAEIENYYCHYSFDPYRGNLKITQSTYRKCECAGTYKNLPFSACNTYKPSDTFKDVENYYKEHGTGESHVLLKNFSLKTIIPRHTVEQNDSAKPFIKKLKKIVKEKDLDGLMPYLSPNIHLSFGGESGIVSFLRFWKLLENPKQSHLWKELDKMLLLGGIMKGNKAMSYPYLFNDWPDNFDVFEYQAITDSKVNLREAPSSKAKVIRQVSYEVVRPIIKEGENSSSTWQKIQTYDKQVGYVYSNYIRSAVDYRMSFEKTCDGWKMNTLIAGD